MGQDSKEKSWRHDYFSVSVAISEFLCLWTMGFDQSSFFFQFFVGPSRGSFYLTHRGMGCGAG
jgi:hypothetical protein